MSAAFLRERKYPLADFADSCGTEKRSMSCSMPRLGTEGETQQQIFAHVKQSVPAVREKSTKTRRTTVKAEINKECKIEYD